MVARSDTSSEKKNNNGLKAKSTSHYNDDWTEEHPYSPEFGASSPPGSARDDVDCGPRVYSASCYCGRVRYDARGEPLSSKICHCGGCQLLHGAPFEWVALFDKENIRFHPCSLQYLYFYNSTLDMGWTSRDASKRQQPVKVSCSHCRSPVADEGQHNWLAFCTLFGFNKEVIIPKAFRHSDHLFYKQRCLDIPDEQPKWDCLERKSSLWQPDWEEEE